MTTPSLPPLTFTLHTSPSLPSLPFSTALHTLINTAFQHPTPPPQWPYPPNFRRLHPSPTTGIAQLIHELTPLGSLLLAFTSADPPTPIACAGFLPRKGSHSHSTTAGDSSNEAAVDRTPSHPEPAYELLFVVTAHAYRGMGLSRVLLSTLYSHILSSHPSIRIKLVVGTVEGATGPFWRRMGFVAVPEACFVLPAGFRHIPESEALTEDTEYWTGERWIGGG